MAKVASSLAAKDAPPEARSEAARLMGQVRTQRKIEAAMANLAKRTEDEKGGRPPKQLVEIECRCAAGEALDGHQWDCPRGQAIKRRKKAGLL